MLNSLSNHTKQELFEALNGNKSGVFVINGKLVSIEIENIGYILEDKLEKNLAEEIEEYTELKASLERYLNNPDMTRYTRSELKAMRHAQRK